MDDWDADEWEAEPLPSLGGPKFEDEDEEEEEDEDHVVRAIFEENLRKAGLETELEPSRVSEICTEMGFDGSTIIC